MRDLAIRLIQGDRELLTKQLDLCDAFLGHLDGEACFLKPRDQGVHDSQHDQRCCTARHGVFATPNPTGANIGPAMKYARHSPSQFGLQGNPPCSCAARCVNSLAASSLAASWRGCR